MARLFDDASSESLDFTGAVVSATPLTMACWFYSDDIAANQTLMSLGNNGTNGMFRLAAMGGVTGDPIRVQSQDDAIVATGTADTTTGFSANTWHHAAAVIASTSSRTVYIDGGSSGSDATAVTNPTPDFTNIGVLQRSAKIQFMSGRVAEAAIWSAALTAAEVASLAKGFSPDQIRPASLVEYWKLYGNSSPEPGYKGNNLTLSGTPTKAEHKPMIYRTRPMIGHNAAAAPPSGRIMSSLVAAGGLAGHGGIAGQGGGLAG